MTQGVNEESRVPTCYCSHKIVNYQRAPSDPPENKDQEQGGDQEVLVDPPELWIFGPILYLLPVGGIVLARHEPQHMTPPEALFVIVGIFESIGVFMVLPMHPCPPKWSLLKGKTAQESHHELNRAGHFVTAVREVAVIHSSDQKHLQEVHSEADHQVNEVEAGVKGGQGSEVRRNEGPGLERNLVGHQFSLMRM